MAAWALSENRTFFHLADFLFALEVALSPGVMTIRIKRQMQNCSSNYIITAADKEGAGFRLP